MPLPSDIPAWVADYIGLPYVSGGRTRDGVDCWGLFTLVHAERLGGPLPDYDGPLWKPGCDRLALRDAATAYSSLFPEIDPADVRLGDGVLLRSGRHPIHLGLIVCRGWMLHAEEGADAALERYDGPAWAPRIVSYHRYEP